VQGRSPGTRLVIPSHLQIVIVWGEEVKGNKALIIPFLCMKRASQIRTAAHMVIIDDPTVTVAMTTT